MITSTKLTRNLAKLVLMAVLFVGCNKNYNKEHNIQTASIISEPTIEEQQESRVKEERLHYTGITILTVDGHEYIHYRDGDNAASVGGICHKIDCSFCLAKNSH